MKYLKKSGQKFKQSLMLMFNLFLFLFGKVVKKDMAVIYATLIVKGVKSFKEVPDRIKDQVRQVLIDLDCDHLIEE